MDEQIGLFGMTLSQKRFKTGAFHFFAVLCEAKFIALDGRFYIERSHGLQPTRNGFRRPSEQVDYFKQVLQKDPRKVGDVVLFQNNAFRFHIRYVNDQYGEGIDFRKYRTKKKYTGWDKAGVRMKIEDVHGMSNWLKDFKVNEVSQANGVFDQNDISRSDGDKADVAVTSQAPVNPIILEIIES